MGSYAEVFTSWQFQRMVKPQKANASELVRTVSPAGAHLMRALEELQRLRRNRTERGLPASDLAFKNAEHCLQRCLADDRTIGPDIMPVDDGGVLLEWVVAGNTYQLEFCIDGSAECAAFDSRGNDLATLDLVFM